MDIQRIILASTISSNTWVLDCMVVARIV